MHFVDRDDVWTGWPCTPAPCLVRAITIVAILLASPALADDPESASITAAGDGSFPVPGDDDDDDDNERPRANDDRAVTEETTTLVIDALANDTDPDGDPLRIVDVEQPSHGTAVHDTSRIIYQPAVGFTGNDKFKYVIADPRGATDSATVHVTVEPANRPPVARDDSASTAEDEPVTIAVLANDEDPDGDALTISDVDRPANGSATIVGDQINYAPRAGFSGTDTFDYVVSDGRETSSARVTVQVSSVNDPPQITGQRSLSTPEETALRITLNDLVVEDEDNDYPRDFTLTVQDGENYSRSGDTITPLVDFEGQLTVPVTVSDGEFDSPVFELAITVSPVNDRPSLVSPIADQTAPEGSQYSLSLRSHFGDPDSGDSLSFATQGLPPSGSLTLHSGSGEISGIPRAEDVRGKPYTIGVTATDRAGASASGEFALIISGSGRADISLELDATPVPAITGDAVLWSFEVENTGPMEAADVELTATVRGVELAFEPPSDPACTLEVDGKNTGTLNCRFTDLAVGTLNVDLSTQATRHGDLAALGSVSVGRPGDSNLANNDDALGLTVADRFGTGPTQVVGSSPSLSVAAGDLDGDGAPDLVVGTRAAHPLEIYFNDGERGFVTPGQTFGETSSARAVVLADIDNDDDLDVVVANDGGEPDTIYINDSTGALTLHASLDSANSSGVAAVDLNGDGFVDLAFTGPEDHRIYRNDGTGNFEFVLAIGNGSGTDVATADLNGDGRRDLVFASSTGQHEIYLNSTSGNDIALAAAQIIEGLPSPAVRLADFDNDGSVDVALAAKALDSGRFASGTILLNNGSAAFGSGATFGVSDTEDLLVGDVDGDGNSDLVLIKSSGTNQVYVGGSGGSLTMLPAATLMPGAASGVLADIDGSGLPDLITAIDAADGGAAVFLNDGAGNFGLGDSQPPVITLLGEAVVSVRAGRIYEDAGATAEDDVDGDITDQIIVDNPVDTAVVGEYFVTYRVSDSAGNEAEPATRRVRVVPDSGVGGGGAGLAGPLLFGLIVLRALRRLRMSTAAPTAGSRCGS